MSLTAINLGFTLLIAEMFLTNYLSLYDLCLLDLTNDMGKYVLSILSVNG